MKTKTLHRHIHPVHWHASMLLAIAAILVTATKTSGEMLRSLSGVTAAHNVVISSLELRDAETVHAVVMLGGRSRLASNSGE